MKETALLFMKALARNQATDLQEDPYHGVSDHLKTISVSPKMVARGISKDPGRRGCRKLYALTDYK